MHRIVETYAEFSSPQQSFIQLENVSCNLCRRFLTSTANSMVHLSVTNILIHKSIFLRMERECFSILTAVFNSIVAEQTYVTGQKNAKVIQRSGIIPTTHQSRFFRKLQERISVKWSENPC